ncbi:MAG: EF-hand domain-containing protein [Phycisphaeraceae bacterium]|nr:EF-hand domain-containing protein [Phycisphaeraceae bacterium]
MNRSTKLAVATLAVVGLAASAAVASPDNKTKPGNNRNTTTNKQPAPATTTAKPTTTPAADTGNVNKQIGTDPEHFTKLFKSVDTNGDGFISVEEWNQLSPRIGASAEEFNKTLNDPKHPKHAQMLRRFDANNNGKFEKTERETAVREWQNTLLNALAIFDKDRDGKFSAEERTAFQVNASNKNPNPNTNAKRAANTNDKNTNPSQPDTSKRQAPSQRRVNVDEKNR